MEVFHIALVFILRVENMFHVDASVTVHTPNDQRYLPLEPLGVTVLDRTSVRFNLTASNDAHVALYTPANETVPLDIYEIVIGGWANSKSVMRIRQQGQTLSVQQHNPLDSSTAKPFWISWLAGVIKVGSGTDVGVNSFMQITDARYNVTAVAVMTAWGSTGVWVFEEEIFSSTSSLFPSSTILMMDTSPDSSYMEDTIPSDYTIYTTRMTESIPSVFQVSSTLTQTLADTDTGTHSTFLKVTSLSSSSFRVPSLVQTTNGISSTMSSTAMDDVNSSSSFHRVTSLGSTQIKEITSLFSPTEVISPLPSLHEVSSQISENTSHLLVTVGVTQTPEEITSAATTSSSTTSTTTSSNDSKLCRCHCRSLLNFTSGEFKDLVKAITKTLTVPKHNLSSSLRKRKSISDERPSSMGIGSGALFLVVLPFAIVVLSDVQTLLCFLMNRPKR